MSTQITHLVLENWRNFRSVDIPLGPRAFIVGPNASGKTNLLDAIRFLSEIAGREGSLARAVNTSRTVLTLQEPRWKPRELERQDITSMERRILLARLVNSSWMIKV